MIIYSKSKASTGFSLLENLIALILLSVCTLATTLIQIKNTQKIHHQLKQQTAHNWLFSMYEAILIGLPQQLTLTAKLTQENPAINADECQLVSCKQLSFLQLLSQTIYKPFTDMNENAFIKIDNKTSQQKPLIVNHWSISTAWYTSLRQLMQTKCKTHYHLIKQQNIACLSLTASFYQSSTW